MINWSQDCVSSNSVCDHTLDYKTNLTALIPIAIISRALICRGLRDISLQASWLQRRGAWHLSLFMADSLGSLKHVPNTVENMSRHDFQHFQGFAMNIRARIHSELTANKFKFWKNCLLWLDIYIYIYIYIYRSPRNGQYLVLVKLHVNFHYC